MAEAFDRRVVRIGGVEMVAEAALNSCGGQWTAIVRAGEELVAKGTGFYPEDAIDVAIERAEGALDGEREE